jgi:hypothetical protein
MRNYIQFLHHLHFLFFFIWKIPEYCPRPSTPPRRWHVGLATALLQLQHARKSLTNIIYHHANLIASPCTRTDKPVLYTRTFLPRPSLCEATASSETRNDLKYFMVPTYYMQTTHAKFQSVPTIYAFSAFFSSKKPKKRPHVTNLATFVKNCSNLACTPQMSTPSAIKNFSSFRVGRKIDFSKTGLPQTSPEGSVSEHINFSTIKKAPHLFLHTHTIKTTSHAQLHSVSTPLTFSFLFYLKNPRILPRAVYPP